MTLIPSEPGSLQHGAQRDLLTSIALRWHP